ncbi:MAG: hypothetical protein JWM16_3671 [Verrucomicrobiales bacterium]|nr:hypothetical protein [Verrucomicrobiales bacterium]
MIAAITGVAWMFLCHSTPAASLLVIRYETNTIPGVIERPFIVPRCG